MAAAARSQLRILTWNISAGKYSSSAPPTWTLEQNYADICETIAIERDCDVIALQEVTLEFHTFLIQHSRLKETHTLVTTVPSHCQHTCIYVHCRHLPASCIIYGAIAFGGEIAPSSPSPRAGVVIRISLNGSNLYVASVHLHPSPDSRTKRLLQLSELIRLCDRDAQLVNNRSASMLFVGDFNMRENEAKHFADFRLKDASVSLFGVQGSFDKRMYSWNSDINRFNTEYFPFTCKFDRVLYNDDLHPLTFRLIGNTPASTNANHYLSNHFGIFSTFLFGASNEQQRPVADTNTVFQDGWIIFEDGSLQDFLYRYPPSRIGRHQACWISVMARSLPMGSTLGSFTTLMREWQQLCNAHSRNAITSETIARLAVKYGELSGKWLIFPNTTSVNEVWSTIAEATVADRLGPSAKVSTVEQDSDQHVICVYSADFTDRNDVMRIRDELRKFGHDHRLTYKADIYTHLNVYAGNKFNIKPTVYSS